MNSQQQQSSNDSGEPRVGASPLHAFVETVERVDSVDSETGSGRVGILARKSEDDACAVFTEEESRPLSPENTILEKDNKLMGTILLAQSEEEEQTVIKTTSEPSLDTEPSSSLLRRNVIVSSSKRPGSSSAALSENVAEEERFSDDLQSVEQQETDIDARAQRKVNTGDCTPELSPYDYDTNWDMVGQARPHEEQAGSTASLLAEAAAATAILATTGIDSPPDQSIVESSSQLQGIAPPQHPSSEYNYNIQWDMTNVAAERHTRTATDDLLLDDDFLDTPVNDTSVTSSVSSLAEAAAATAMLKGAAVRNETAVNNENEDDPLQQPVPVQSRISSPLLSRSTRQQMTDASYFYSYSQQDGNDRGDPSGEGVTSLVGDEDNREDSAPLTPTSFEALVRPTIASADTRSEMNESISTTTSSSSGGASSTRRRRHSRRLHAQSRSSSSASLRSRRSSSEIPPLTEEDATSCNTSTSERRLRASLDSGMAAVRRWVRTRGEDQAPSARSSRAARRWQSQHGGDTTLQLGDEDVFALTHAGEDPRGILRHYDDSSVTEPTYLRSAMQLPVVEEVEEPRQRSLSEPDGNRLRDFFFERTVLRRRPAAPSSGGASTELSATSGHLQTAALTSSFFHSSSHRPSWSIEMVDRQQADRTSQLGDGTTEEGDAERVASTQVSGGSFDSEGNDLIDSDPDPNREARTRWIRINRRFQLIITLVALVFSLLLFAILVCWVVLTSAFVISIDKACDVALKTYFWLATFQLILDVFRTDIMRVIFRWDTNSNERIPPRVIVYNIAYLIYAMLVLRLGVRSVFTNDDSTCPETAPELFQASSVFVILSISAWSIIVLGYLVPFCFVAVLLTWNGYNPTGDGDNAGSGPGVTAMGAFGSVFPGAYGNSGAPPGCVDQLRVVVLEEFPAEYPQECCICMGDFCEGEVIVATACDHVFHKLCCQEWLRQARTCPVCRTDIPASIAGGISGGSQPDEQHPVSAPSSNRPRLGTHFTGPPGQAFGREEFHQEVVNLFRILRQHEERRRQQRNSNDTINEEEGTTNSIGNDATDEEALEDVDTRVNSVETEASRFTS